MISSIKSCGSCSYCKIGPYSHCIGGEGVSRIGWFFGYLIDETKVEYVRFPYAEISLHILAETIINRERVMHSGICPLGFEIGFQYKDVKPGEVVAVIWVGPVGMAAIATSDLYKAEKSLQLI